MRVLLLFLIVCSARVAFAQTYVSKAAVLEDLRYWEAAVREGHPQVRLSGYDITECYAALEADPRDSLDIFAVDSLFRRATWLLGCTHTTVRGARVMPVAEPYLPYRVAWVDNELFLIGAGNDSAKAIIFPFRVDSINQRPVAEVLAFSTTYAPSDGYQPGWGKVLTDEFGHFLLRRVLHRDSNLTIVGTDGAGDRRRFTTAFTATFQPFESGPALPDFRPVDAIPGASWGELAPFPETLWLRITNFEDRKFRGFYRRLFDAADRGRYTRLVIDLRRNGGGNRHHATNLLRHLLDTPFGYRMQKPSTGIIKYVGWKAMVLESMRFSLMEFYRSRQDRDGREVRFLYRPRKRSFGGDVFVLTDERTASSASLVTALLQNEGRATVIGRETAGGVSGNNGGSFPRLTLPNTGIKIVFPLYRLVYGRTGPEVFRHHGVRPDHTVDYAPEAIVAGRDPWVEKLTELLQDR